jgi:Protein of unknown function (DUF2934)
VVCFSIEDEGYFQERQMQEQLQELQERLLSSSEVREMIARRAYEIYERRGHMPGHDKEDWFQAEREVLNRFMREDFQNRASKAATSHSSQLERAGMAAKKAVERTAKRMKTTSATVSPKTSAQPSLAAQPNDKSKPTPKSLKTRPQKAAETVVSEATETVPSIPETGPDERISRRTSRSKTASATKENSPGAPKKSLS